MFSWLICSLQLSASVQIPSSMGGVEGDTLYIDTRGGLNMQRLVKICTATHEHCKTVASNKTGIFIVYVAYPVTISRMHVPFVFQCYKFTCISFSIQIITQIN